MIKRYRCRHLVSLVVRIDTARDIPRPDGTFYFLTLDYPRFPITLVELAKDWEVVDDR